MKNPIKSDTHKAHGPAAALCCPPRPRVSWATPRPDVIMRSWGFYVLLLLLLAWATHVGCVLAVDGHGPILWALQSWYRARLFLLCAGALMVLKAAALKQVVTEYAARHWYIDSYEGRRHAAKAAEWIVEGVARWLRLVWGVCALWSAVEALPVQSGLLLDSDFTSALVNFLAHDAVLLLLVKAVALDAVQALVDAVQQVALDGIEYGAREYEWYIGWSHHVLTLGLVTGATLALPSRAVFPGTLFVGAVLSMACTCSDICCCMYMLSLTSYHTVFHHWIARGVALMWAAVVVVLLPLAGVVCFAAVRGHFTACAGFCLAFACLWGMHFHWLVSGLVLRVDWTTSRHADARKSAKLSQ